MLLVHGTLYSKFVNSFWILQEQTSNSRQVLHSRSGMGSWWLLGWRDDTTRKGWVHHGIEKEGRNRMRVFWCSYTFCRLGSTFAIDWLHEKCLHKIKLPLKYGSTQRKKQSSFYHWKVITNDQQVIIAWVYPNHSSNRQDGYHLL